MIEHPRTPHPWRTESPDQSHVGAGGSETLVPDPDLLEIKRNLEAEQAARVEQKPKPEKK